MRTLNFVRFFLTLGSVDLAFSGILSDKPSLSLFRNEYALKKLEYPENPLFRLHHQLRCHPYPVKFYDRQSKETLRDAIAREKYDYILVRYAINVSDLYPLLRQSGRAVMVDFDDIISGPLYNTYFEPSTNPAKKIIREINRQILRRFERRCTKLGISLFCSEKDRVTMMQDCIDNASIVVPNVFFGDGFAEYDFGDGFLSHDTLLFLGTLSYRPNIDGLSWFIKRIFIPLKARLPHLRLCVVGAYPSSEVIELCRSTSDVELFPNVPDVKKFYHRCGVVIVPLLSGGGTRIKILEAAFAGRPVLSTPIGAEGLGLVDGKDILLFENHQDFLDKYLQLDNQSFYLSLADSLHKAVISRYSYRAFSDAMLLAVQQADEMRNNMG
jgi:glycosyltransferase involved in cell wall biosynthesis